MLHPAVRKLLLELVPRIFDPLARGLDVVDADTRVPKASVGLDVAVVDLVGVIVLGAVVVRELDESLAVERLISVGEGLGGVVAEEVEVELEVGEGELIDEAHAEELIEFDYGYLG